MLCYVVWCCYYIVVPVKAELFTWIMMLLIRMKTYPYIQYLMEEEGTWYPLIINPCIYLNTLWWTKMVMGTIKQCKRQWTRCQITTRDGSTSRSMLACTCKMNQAAKISGFTWFIYVCNVWVCMYVWWHIYMCYVWGYTISLIRRVICISLQTYPYYMYVCLLYYNLHVHCLVRYMHTLNLVFNSLSSTWHWSSDMICMCVWHWSWGMIYMCLV